MPTAAVGVLGGESDGRALAAAVMNGGCGGRATVPDDRTQLMQVECPRVREKGWHQNGLAFLESSSVL